MGRAISKENVVVRELPSGYSWRTERYADDEGIVLSVTLVASNHQPGTWKDRLFGRQILNASREVSIDAEAEEIEEKFDEMKTSIFSLFFKR
jgi:hypothetical protein